jgi:methionine-rich copper-binding protein CopC
MRTSRMLVLMLLVVMTTLLPIATSVAHADAFDQAYQFAHDLCQYYYANCALSP